MRHRPALALLPIAFACSNPAPPSDSMERPGAPEGFVAEVDRASVRLSWRLPKNSERVLLARADRDSDEPQPQDHQSYTPGEQLGAHVIISETAETSLVDLELECGLYTYRAWALSPDGLYSTSAKTNASVSAAPESVPSQLQAEYTEAGVSLSWEASGADHVIVERTYEGTSEIIYRGAQRSYLDETAPLGAELTYSVRECNACRVCNKLGVQTDVTAAPPAPLPEAEPVTISAWNRTVQLEFVAPTSVEGVRITRAIGAAPTETDETICSPCTSPLIDQDLINGETYFYRVRTFDGQRQSDGIIINATPSESALPEVSGASFRALNAEVEIDYTSPQNAPEVAGIRIMRRDDAPVLGPQDGEVVCDPCTAPVEDEPLQNGVTYHYRIFTYDAVAPTSYSAGIPGSATPVLPVPLDVSRAEFIPRDQAVLLEWNEPRDLGFEGVKILRSNVPVMNESDGDVVCAPCTSPHLDMGLTNGTTYHYGIFAYHTDGRFSPGITGSATPATPPPLQSVPGTGLLGATPVAMDGAFAVLGSPLDDDAGQDSGAALVFEHSASGWIQIAKLVNPEAEPGARFGCSVAIESRILVVGACRGAGNAIETDAGAAYVFVQDTAGLWNASGYTKLTAPAPDNNDDFAASVAISGDLIAITEHDNDDLANNAGAVWIFERMGTSWAAPTRLTAFDFVANQNFGRGGVAIDQNTVVVSAYSDSGRAGAIYIFERSGPVWNVGEKHTAPVPVAQELFGISVDIDQDLIVAGARQSEIGTSAHAGRAYVFERTAGLWSHASTLAASDFFAFSYFGVSVSVFDDKILVGADRDGGAGDYGAAYVFERNAAGSFAQTLKLTQPVLTDDAHLGWRVAGANNRLLISSDSNEPVFSYELSP